MYTRLLTQQERYKSNLSPLVSHKKVTQHNNALYHNMNHTLASVLWLYPLNVPTALGKKGEQKLGRALGLVDKSPPAAKQQTTEQEQWN